MAERCINLTADEARAWAAGATALIRPSGVKGGNVASTRADMRACWTVGDVLIGREEFGTFTNVGAKWISYHADAFVQVIPAKAAWIIDDFVARRPANKMPQALARHRRRVVSVRVCRECDVTWDEAAAAVGTTPVTSALQWRIAMGYLGHNFGDAWVSVTITEAADVR